MSPRPRPPVPVTPGHVCTDPREIVLPFGLIHLDHDRRTMTLVGEIDLSAQHCCPRPASWHMWTWHLRVIDTRPAGFLDVTAINLIAQTAAHRATTGDRLRIRGARPLLIQVLHIASIAHAIIFTP